MTEQRTCMACVCREHASKSSAVNCRRPVHRPYLMKTSFHLCKDFSQTDWKNSVHHCHNS